LRIAIFDRILRILQVKSLFSFHFCRKLSGWMRRDGAMGWGQVRRFLAGDSISSMALSDEIIELGYVGKFASNC